MNNGNQFRRAMGLTSIGLEFVVAGGLPILGGYWCDGRFKTTPWLTIVGVLVGLTAATYTMIRRVTAVWKREQNPDKSDREL